MDEKIKKAAEIIKRSRFTAVFTGGGISVESGIPPFRGKGGIWEKYDPEVLELAYFHRNPAEAWRVIRKIFYDFMGRARPNAAHRAVADLEKAGFVKAVITQNIDNLHREAGSQTVYEYHGTVTRLLCLECGSKTPAAEVSLEELPPKCPHCSGLLKPDFIFFSEQIPEPANSRSFQAAEQADVLLIVGSTGEVMPAALIPFRAKETAAKIIEVNPVESHFTAKITDIFLQGKAAKILPGLAREVLRN